ncbi:MAG: PGPGW domain-containing protein [Ilumatobacter sp.]
MNIGRRAGAQLKKAVVLVVGVAVVLVGVALLALPGPGMITIIVGLLILSTEFDWAKRWLDYAVEKTAGATTSIQGTKSGRIMLGLSGVGLIVIGIVICVFFSRWILGGISTIFAGIIGLATLHPKVGEWVEERALYGIDGKDDYG